MCPRLSSNPARTQPRPYAELPVGFHRHVRSPDRDNEETVGRFYTYSDPMGLFAHQEMLQSQNPLGMRIQLCRALATAFCRTIFARIKKHRSRAGSESDEKDQRMKLAERNSIAPLARMTSR